MRIIGLTGGIGSGKSTISKILAQMDIKIIDADTIARQVVKKGQPALKEIVESFGWDILLKNGELNREKLGGIVFSNKEKLKVLNKITHKYIMKEIEQKIEDEKRKKRYSKIIIDAALLIEVGLNKICDEVWLVVADKELRIKRIMERDLLSLEETKKRIKLQITDEKRLQYATSVIHNNNDHQLLELRVKELISTNNKLHT